MNRHQNYVDRLRNNPLHNSINVFHTNNNLAANNAFVYSFASQHQQQISDLNKLIKADEKNMAYLKKQMSDLSRLTKKHTADLNKKFRITQKKIIQLDEQKNQYSSLLKTQQLILQKAKKNIQKIHTNKNSKFASYKKFEDAFYESKDQHQFVVETLLNGDFDFVKKIIKEAFSADRDSFCDWLIRKRMTDEQIGRVIAMGGSDVMAYIHKSIIGGIYVWSQEIEAAGKIADMFSIVSIFFSTTNKTIQKIQKEGGSFSKFKKSVNDSHLSWKFSKIFIDIEIAIGKSLIKKPLASVKQGKPFIGTKFGASRDRGKRRHAGIDLIASTDTPVYSPGVGKVVASYKSKEGRNGETLVVLHGDFKKGTKTYSIVTYYFHLSKRLLKKGQIVLAGQKIAKSGKSSSAKPVDPHLHYEVRVIPKSLITKKGFSFRKLIKNDKYAKDPLDYMWPSIKLKN